MLVKYKFQPASLDRVLYFHAAASDAVLHDAVTEILVPMVAQSIQFPTACMHSFGRSISGDGLGCDEELVR